MPLQSKRVGSETNGIFILSSHTLILMSLLAFYSLFTQGEISSCFIALQLADRQRTSSVGWRSAQAPPSPAWQAWLKPSLWLPTMRWPSSDSSRCVYILAPPPFCDLCRALKARSTLWCVRLPLLKALWCVSRMAALLMQRHLKKQPKPLMKFPLPWPRTTQFSQSSRCPRTVLSSSRRWPLSFKISLACPVIMKALRCFFIVLLLYLLVMSL